MGGHGPRYELLRILAICAGTLGCIANQNCLDDTRCYGDAGTEPSTIFGVVDAATGDSLCLQNDINPCVIDVAPIAVGQTSTLRLRVEHENAVISIERAPEIIQRDGGAFDIDVANEPEGAGTYELSVIFAPTEPRDEAATIVVPIQADNTDGADLRIQLRGEVATES